MIHGSIVALVTPFKNGAVDERSFQDLIEWHIESGTCGIVPAGTTGETSTLSHKEHDRVISLAVEAAAKRVPVIAGTGSNSTAEAHAFLRHACSAGADAALIVTPYYNKPTQRGLYLHFESLNNESQIPIILYNIPGRSVIDIEPETMAALSRLPRIIGIKDATGRIERVTRQRELCGKDFIQLSGEDITALAFNAHGGVGCISVTANIAPVECADFQKCMAIGDYKSALEFQDKLAGLHTSLFVESNPCPAKYALSLMGKCSPEVRLPLAEISEQTQKIVREALTKLGILT